MRRLVNESLMRSIVGNMDRMYDYAGAGMRQLNEAGDDDIDAEGLSGDDEINPENADIVAGDEIEPTIDPSDINNQPDMGDEEGLKGEEAEDEDDAKDIDAEIKGVCDEATRELISYLEDGEKQIDADFFVDDILEKLSNIDVSVLNDRYLKKFIEEFNESIQGEPEVNPETGEPEIDPETGKEIRKINIPDAEDVSDELNRTIHGCGIKYNSGEAVGGRTPSEFDDDPSTRSTKDLIGRDEDEGFRRGAPTIETQMARDADRALGYQKHRINALALSKLQDEVRKLGAKGAPFTLHDAIESVIRNTSGSQNTPTTDKNGKPFSADLIHKIRKQRIDKIIQRDRLIQKIKASVPNIDFDSPEKIEAFCSDALKRQSTETELGDRILPTTANRIKKRTPDVKLDLEDETGRRHGRAMKGITFSEGPNLSRLAQLAQIASAKLAMAIDPEAQLKDSVNKLNAFNAQSALERNMRAKQMRDEADNERLSGFAKDLSAMIPDAEPSESPEGDTVDMPETETPQMAKIKDLIGYQGPKDKEMVETIDMILRAKRMWGYEKDADQSLFDESNPREKMKQERKKKEETQAEMTAGSYFRNLLMSDTVKKLTNGQSLAPSHVLFEALATIHDRQINHNAFSGNDEIDIGNGQHTYIRHKQNRNLSHRKDLLKKSIDNAEATNKNIIELLNILNRGDQEYSNYDEFMGRNEDGKYLRILFANFGEEYKIYADRLTELSRISQARNMDEFVKFNIDSTAKETKANHILYIGLVGSTDDMQMKCVSSPEELATIFKLWIGDEVEGLGGPSYEDNEQKLLSLFPTDVKDFVRKYYDRLFIPEEDDVVSKIYAMAPDGTPYAYNPDWDPPIRTLGELSPRTANKAAKKKRGKAPAESAVTAAGNAEIPMESFNRYSNLFNAMYREICENSL